MGGGVDNAYSVGDVLAGVFALLPEGRRAFQNNRAKMQEFFYRQQNFFPKLLEGVVFRNWGTSFDSNKLDQVWSNLNVSGLVSSTAYGPSWVKDKCRKAYRAFSRDRFSRGERIDIYRLSQKFGAEFCA